MQGSRLAKRYVLGERLGEGGMGVVYRATDLRTGGPVAVKLLPPALAHSAVWRQRLQREAKLAAGLSSPRVVRVLDLFDHQGTPVLVMEYVAGETLADLLRRRGRLPVPEAVDLAREIARALAAAHAQGVIHRDLKPANIKLVEGQVKVLDFGLARLAAGDGLSASGGYLGTPEYSAPEQADGQADERTDVYALGIVLYELLRGQPPFRGPTPLSVLRQHVEAPVPPLPDEVSEDLRAVVARCLAKEPARRYQSAAELDEALVDLQRRLGASRTSRPGRATATLDLPPAEDTPPRHNLPAQLSSFVGREQEVAAVRQLLATHRLVTLTGPGGIGKTRLALQAAADLVGSCPDGVWLVELAPLADPALVSQAMATAVGVREQPGRPVQQTLAEALRPRRLLLVLDNCEHLVAACAELAEVLLRACPDLRILATSREVLRIAGEMPWRVPSLGLPPLPPAGPSSPTDPSVPALRKQVEDSEAVRLFVARAAVALPGFVLTDASTPTVARICHQLDGLPLAIELAAARVSALGLEQLAARLADRFRLLTGGSRTALPRHQTLRATLEWSYALLTEPEQRLFERLAVFAGGWTLEAAEAVGAGEGIEPADVLELLMHLVDKSLVVAQEGLGGEERYRLLETLREYGWERLAKSGQAEAARHRHVAYFLALVERAEPELMGEQQAIWLTRLEQEHDNLRAALQWTTEGGEAELGLRLAGAVWRFWWIRGHFSEGRRWFDGLLAVVGKGGAALTATRAKALSGAGALARDQGDYSRAAALLEESLVLFREAGDRRGSAWALNYLGLTAAYQGDYRRAAALLEESLALFREVGDRRGSAWSLNHLGLTASYQGDYRQAAVLLEESLALRRDLGEKRGIAWSLNHLARVARDQGESGRATALLEESLALRRDLGDKRGIAWSLNDLARVARDHGEYSRAAALSEESLALFRSLGDQWGSAWSLHILGCVAAYQDEYGRATALLEESLALRRDLGDKRGIAESLEELAGVATHTGQPERAARLFEAAEALRQAIGAPLPPADQAAHDRGVAAARARLGEQGFAAAWADGRAMPVEGA